MPTERNTEIVTVAAVRGAKNAEEILFNEKQQIFSLRTQEKSRPELLGRLREVLKKNEPLRVVLDPRKGVIQRIGTVEPGEVEEFHRNRKLLEKPAKSVAINIDEIDPTAFNLVGRKLKWPAFKLCKKTLPNYSKAKQIFDFCANQSCNLPGPYAISPCIPFQYVIDGCYARAHKMRKIIAEKYGYCCEKVFSFANQNSDTLAVQANKWGGCCVFWWYHVAPLVRVRIKLLSISIELALVIDPGMFDKPVLLSSWLSAQKNTACSADANVSMYSIQPGSAYSPANYAGTQFTTDPNYTATDQTLLNYQNLTTC
ncbi:MAG TPA: protein-glutamine glutaminase family protein [Terriglobales bacterium]